MHLQNLMQRVEMEMEGEGSLAAIFIDSVDSPTDAAFERFYNSLFTSGDLIREYSHVLDCIGIEQSHHSVGIQIADYVSGVTDGWLKGYMESSAIFNGAVMPLLRRSSGARLTMGYGLIEVPTDSTFRAELRTRLYPSRPVPRDR